VAPSSGALIAARAVQALGAAAIVPASLGLILAEFPLEQRTFATGLWAAAGAVAAAAGPSLGGVLVHAEGWRSVFFVNVPIAAAVLAGSRVLVERREEGGAPLPDAWSAVWLAGSMGLIALGIVKGPDWGWGDARVLGAWLVGAVLLFALVRRTPRVAGPIVQPELLRIRSFVVASAATCVYFVAFYAFLLANVLFMTEVWRYSALTAGFALSVGPLVSAVVAGPAGRIAERTGARLIALLGVAVFATGCLLYVALTGAHPDYLGTWLPAQLVAGCGIGLTVAGLTGAAARDLPAAQLATGTATTSCVRQLGAVLGIAALVAVVGTPAPARALGVFHHAYVLAALVSLAAGAVAVALPAAQRSASAAPSAPRPSTPSLR
jgi:NTE family protein